MVTPTSCNVGESADCSRSREQSQKKADIHDKGFLRNTRSSSHCVWPSDAAVGYVTEPCVAESCRRSDQVTRLAGLVEFGAKNPSILSCFWVQNVFLCFVLMACSNYCSEYTDYLPDHGFAHIRINRTASRLYSKLLSASSHQPYWS